MRFVFPTLNYKEVIEMKKEVLDYVINETNALINAGSTCKESKEAAEKWL